jgi:4-amino-4-deoxy-L-arabinose transferase-like glycosyltransferase
MDARTDAADCWKFHAAAFALIVGAAVFRVLYLALDCPLDLAPDEAHYWDWSRRLDWSYYSKGPLVAWLIRLGCETAGSWSRSLLGHDMLAVRLPAVVCGSLLLASLYVLTLQVYSRPRLALAVLALALTLPPITAGSLLMTIDSPYCCAWGWALVLAHHALFARKAWAWPALGLVVAVGVLAKHTMVLFLPLLALFLLAEPTGRAFHWRGLVRPGFWVAAAFALLGALPILVWNAHHDWVTFRHTSGHAGLTSQGLHWLGPVVYVGTQVALLLGVWFAVWLAALVAHRPWIEPDPRLRFLWWMSAPMVLFFALFSLKNGGGEPNWPITGYLAGMVLAAGWFERAVFTQRRRDLVVASTLAVALGLGLTVVVHHTEWLHPALELATGPPTPDHPLPIRRLDPTCRLRGWKELAQTLDTLRDQLRREGVEPLLAGTGWTLPGEMGFYCAGQPVVYSFGPLLGDRRSQYDIWRPNPVADPEMFLGRTFVVVGATAMPPEMFDRVEPPILVVHAAQGRPLAHFPVVVCRGYRGPSSLSPPPRY